MIRMLVPSDISSCLKIYNWYIRCSTATFETEELSEEAFRSRVERITSRYPWIVLEEEGQIVGYAYLDAFHERRAYRFTCDLSIYLDHEKRGRGYGSQLMNEIIRIAVRDGYHEMVSLITEGNTASEAIHSRFGFERAGGLEGCGFKNDRWLGVSWYVRKLCPQQEHPAEPQNLSL